MRVHRRRPWLVRYWWLPPTIVAVAAVALLAAHFFSGGRAVHPLAGYIGQVATVEDEYLRYYGKPLLDRDLEKQFAEAGQLAQKGEYNGALLLTEVISRKAAVPSIFTNLGLLYLKLGDRGRGVRSFRDALARDPNYLPVRRVMERLKGAATLGADPVTVEVEPNNSTEEANVIALGKPVDAEIGQLDDDVDVFRVTSPPSPRDLLAIQVQNRSQTLAPKLSIYNEDGIILPLGKESAEPGASLTQVLVFSPNTTFFVYLSGLRSTGGAYTLTVRPLKAFDAYEPNDDIYSARKIAAGQAVEANIMDPDDMDFYSFVAPRTGTVSIDISAGATLLPALSTYGPEKRMLGFGPDVRKPGAPLHHTMAVQEGSTYYVQVWPQQKTSGGYTLKIQ